MKRLLRTRNIFLAVVFLGIFGMAARNVTDPDIWWHLKTGQFIAEHRSVPRTDPFSYTCDGQSWVAHEWLSELFLYELQRASGSTGLITTFATIECAAFFLLYLRCGRNAYVAGVATLVAAWATAPIWGVRPQVVSLLLTSLWLLILECSERKPWLLWWTLPLTLLWVNLHAGFALGLALSALFLAGRFIERAFDFAHQGAPRLKLQTLILLLDLFIVPLNPNGLRMFVYPIETLRSAAMQKYIAEWASPNFHRPEYWLFLLLVLATFAVLSWSRVPLRPRDLLLLVICLYAGLSSIRLIPLFVLIAAPMVCQRLGDWPRNNSQALSQRPERGFCALLNGVIVLAMVAFVGVHVALVVQHEPQAERQNFPTEAVRFLQAHPAAGRRIFNDYDWGGYLIWKLYPSTRVFIDGRADLYAGPVGGESKGGSLLEQFADTYQFKDSWERPLERWDVNTVLIPPNSALAVGLQSAPGWTVLYKDPQAIVLALAAPSRTQMVPGCFQPLAEGATESCTVVTRDMQ